MESSLYPERIALAPSSHYSAGRGAAIDSVIIHATGGRNSQAWLTHTSDPPVSCHVLITKGGERIRIVRDGDTAWHAGNGLIRLATLAQVNVNSRSLGVELENLNDGKDAYPKAQLEALGYQLITWHKTFPNLRWYFHRDVDVRKRDPTGLYMGEVRRIHDSVLCRMLSGAP
jgi:N-acetylmuramoyl-L-alanine amidase